MGGRKRERLFSVSLKGLILLAGILGQLFSLGRHGSISGALFFYYTNISNILAVLLAAFLFAIELRALLRGSVTRLPGWLSAIRLAVSSGILLTFAVFSLLLLPRLSLDYVTSPANLLVHNLVPLLACLDYVVFGRGDGKKVSSLPGLALPLAYFVFVMGLMLRGVRFGGAAAPYFFLDYRANGWFSAGGGSLGVFWWLLILCAMSLLLTRILLWLRSLAVRRFGEEGREPESA